MYITEHQHCTAEDCYTFSHTAGYCGKPQPRQCHCSFCYPDDFQYTLSKSEWLDKMVERKIFTIDAGEKDKCCGIERDDLGVCQHRDYHPIYVDPSMFDL